jgi:hypothetical protein
MPDERSRLAARASELRSVLQDTHRDDVRVAIRESITECERRLTELDEEKGKDRLPLEPAVAADLI